MTDSSPPQQTTPLAYPGAVVAGKYRLDQLIGQGGMGSVWSATHTGLGQQIAIKLISTSFVRSHDALRRFDTEAKAAAQIKSRFVPQVFDNGVLEDGTPYIAMELLHGESLYTRVHTRGLIPLPEAVNILSQCCRALARAHTVGIVHRDIKPDNIYLARSVDDDGYVVKVLDFGIAKIKMTGEGPQSSTRTGTLLGTPLYMSPEQARGLRTLDHRTDIYSLGLVSYTMLTGNLAFSSESFGDLLLQICTQPLPSLRASAPWLPEAMELWFQRACAREPDERYDSAKAFLDGLREASGVPAPEIHTGMMQQTPELAPAPVIRPAGSSSDSGITAPAPPKPGAGAPIAGGMQQQSAPRPMYGSQPEMAPPQAWGQQQPAQAAAPPYGPPPQQYAPQPYSQQASSPPQYAPPPQYAHPPQHSVSSTGGGSTLQPAGVPKRGSGLVVALVIIAFLVLGGGVAALAMVMRGGGKTTAGPSPQETTTATATATTATATTTGPGALTPLDTPTAQTAPTATATHPNNTPNPPPSITTTATTATATAAATSTATATVTATTTSEPPHVNCDPPYYINSQGIKVPKQGC